MGGLKEAGLLCALQVQQKVGLLPTDLMSLITVQRRKLLILKGCIKKSVNHLEEGLIIIMDSASYHCTIIDKIKFLTQDLIKKRRFLNDCEKRILNVNPQKS
jgi:hypothetical protein